MTTEESFWQCTIDLTNHYASMLSCWLKKPVKPWKLSRNFACEEMLSIQLYLRETPLALRTASTKIAIFMNHTLNCESNSSPIVWGWSSESRVSAALRMSSISISYKWKIHYTLDYHTAHCQLVNRYKFRSLSHVLATLQIRQDNFGWWSKLKSSQRAQSLSTLGFYEDFDC